MFIQRFPLIYRQLVLNFKVDRKNHAFSHLVVTISDSKSTSSDVVLDLLGYSTQMSNLPILSAGMTFLSPLFP